MFFHHARRFASQMRIAAYGGVIKRACCDGIALRKPSVINDVEICCDSTGPSNNRLSPGQFREVVAIPGTGCRSLVIPSTCTTKAVYPHQFLYPGLWWHEWCRRRFDSGVVENRDVVDTAIYRARFKPHNIGYGNAC